MKVQFNAKLSVYNNRIQISEYNRTKGGFNTVPFVISNRGVYIHSMKETLNEKQFTEYANNCNTFVTLEAYPTVDTNKNILYVVTGVRDGKEIENK